MNFNRVRNISFWLLDFLRGSSISHHLKEIQGCIEQPNSDNTKKINNKNLTALISHALKTVPYYKEMSGLSDVSDFPIIEKTVIQNNFERFQSIIYIDKANFKVSTSGSTGAPFFLFQDKNKRQRNRADVLYYFNRAGYTVGDRLYELEVWRGHNQKAKLKSWLQNAFQFDISRLTDDRIDFFLNRLKSDAQKNKVFLGFASAYEIIAQYMDRNDISLKNSGITSAIANSEYLNSYTKITLGKHLTTIVLSRYSSEEIGIIAQQTMDLPNEFLVNSASYYVEILSLNSNTPAKIGEFGRIVITDLFNYAMPIIRYDTGDIAKSGFNKDGSMVFTQVQGRKMDVIYDTNGNMVSSFVVYTKFYNYYHLLKQYQFIQQGKKEYEVKLNLHDDVFQFEDLLVADIKSDFGCDAQVIITYVDDIPILASGKRRKVINNFKSSNFDAKK